MNLSWVLGNGTACHLARLSESASINVPDIRGWGHRWVLGLLMLGAIAQAQAAQVDPAQTQMAQVQAACSYSINLYTPTSGSNFTAPATVAFSADAGGSPDGCEVGIVKFYNGTTLLAQVSPDVNGFFTYNWTGVAAGTYTVKAVTGNGAATKTATITVSPPANQLPSVTMGTPTGSPFIAPAAVGLSASASDTDGTINKVEFFQGANLIATDTSAPYTASFTASAAGAYSFTAKATDNTGAHTTSAPVSATVSANALPTVSITAPSNGASYISPATISISVNASDNDGSIAKVVFYANGTLLTSDTSSPYTASWSTGNVGGTFPITATATDDKGGQRSSSINVVLNTPTGSLSGSPDPCTITSGDTCQTTVSWSSNDPNAQIWRHYDYYYQVEGHTDEAHSATQVGTGSGGSAQFDIGGSKRNQYFELKSGGAVVTSIAPRSNYPAATTLTAPATAQVFQAPVAITLSATATDADGSVNRVAFYADGALIATDITAPYSTVWSNAATGNHVVGAQAYDNDGASRPQVTASVVVNAQPTVSYTGPSSGTIVSLGSAVTLSANASDSDGSISKVEFYADDALVATDTGSPYSYSWTPTTAKTYALTVKAYDDRGGTTVTNASTLVVNQAPAVTLTAPTAGTILNAPGTVTLSANASDSDGSVSKIEFYRNGVLITTDSAAPFSYVWSNVAAGQYAITAKAYDDRGTTSTTAATNLIINGLPSGSISYPASGAVVAAPANILVQTSVSDPDDGVAIVEFWVDGVLRATDTAAPFTLQADNMSAGTYALQIRVFDNQGGATYSAVSTLIVNERPQVTLVSPSNGTGIVVPATITLAATASDADGTIDRVEFYDGSTLVGTVTAAPYQLSWTVPASGDRTLTARAIDNRGTATTSAPSVLRGRNQSFDLVPDGLLTSLFGELPGHDPTVGRVAGEAGVSGGAATYTIPIVVPPGRGGVQPELSLGYSSRAGNGIAGMGWSLSGLSAISRCPSTLDQDGIIRPVELSANDKLCLDGQRLVATSGVYGQTGATYATEIDSFARVTQLGGALNSAATYFKVETKSGDIVYYGGNSAGASEARVVPGGVALPMTWLIERRQDRVGNFVRYVYANYGYGETVLSSILYTGYGSTDGNRQVQFFYETRPSGTGVNDQSSSYVAGGLTRQTIRLKTILTRVGLASVRAYVLAYQASAATGRSLLASVTDCGYGESGAACKPPTTFAWQSAPVMHRFSRLNLTAAAGLPSLKWEFVTSAGGGDFNGDGTRDVFGVGINPASPNVKQGYLLALSPDRQITSAIQIDPDSPLQVYGQNGDFDLDGRTDVISYDSSRNILIWFWHGPANATSTSQALTDVWNTGISIPQGYLEHVGDMDGDGRPDIVVSRPAASQSDSCRYVVETYLNKPGAGASSPATFAKHNQWFCLRSYSDPYTAGLFHTESIEKVEDLNGDGLPEIFIKRPRVTPSSWSYDRFYYACRGDSLCGADYSLLDTSLYASYSSTDPRASYVEGILQSGAPQSDINGDGLPDLSAGCPELTAPDKFGGIRLNTGRGFGPCGLIHGTLGALPPRGIGAGRGGSSDLDGDGRSESLLPRGYASRVCSLYVPACPAGDERPACQARYLCPEDFTTGDINPQGTAYFNGSQERVGGLYASGYGNLDSSAYLLKARRYIETGPGEFRVEEFDTPLVAGLDSHFGDDMFGDGLADGVTHVNCMFSDAGWCVTPDADGAGNPISDAAYPRTLPDGSPILSQGIFINENLGPGGLMAPDGVTPQSPDMMSGVQDGLGVQTVWTYYPLSSKAGRGPNDTPLYTVPSDVSARYIDGNHVYFTSSMQVVSDMVQSDGVGDYRSWRYGYSEAMYNTRGRGFQGFRTIVEEDEAAGIRTTTTFHQKFPLTSQPEQITVNSLKRAGTTAPISRQSFTWRCNRNDRGDASACTPSNGTATARFPYLDTTETWTFDAAIADNPAAGTPPLVSYKQSVAADDTSCAGSFSSASGYDAYGNLTANTELVYDSSGSGGYRTFVSMHCTRTRTAYAAADTMSWWLDKVDARTVATWVAYDAGNHALPAGASSPLQSVTTTYTWNADRTPDTQTVQPGVPNQQRVTGYAYPSAGSNYGLPSTVTVNASGDPNGARITSMTYSADGYFPRTVTNALLQTITTTTRAEDGQPSQVIDANGLRVTTQYDAFGFATRMQYRGQTDSDYAAPDKLMSLSWCTSCFAQGKMRVTAVQDGSPTQYKDLDQFGRTVGTAGRLSDGTWSYTATRYDVRGNVTLQSQPYRTGDAIYWTRYQGYDVLRRLLQKTVPQNNQDGRGDLVTKYAYSGRQTAIQVCGSEDSDNAKCLNLSRTTDSLGRYVETIDAAGSATRFWYDGSGNAIAIRDANGSVIKAAYNALGQRTSVDDPNQGHWSFSYDALGEVLSQTDAKGIVTSTAYDALGRVKQRSASYDYDDVAGIDTVVDTWSFDPANAQGLERHHERSLNGTRLRRVTTAYDTLSRPVSQTFEQAGSSGALTQQTSYDAYYGRPKAQSFGNGEALWLQYSAYGDLVRETDPANGTDYRHVTAVDAAGHPISETYANGNLTATRSYSTQTGQLLSVVYGSLGNASLRRLDYRYDVFGNLARQSLNSDQSVEAYQYDVLQRLTQATRTGAATGTVDYGYDAIGNLTRKTDFSTTAANAYGYSGGSCGGGPNAVKNVALQAGGSRMYCYDANGNLTGDSAGLGLRYDHTQRPLRITRAGVTSTFDYDVDGSRFRQLGSDTVQYFPTLERRSGKDTVYAGSVAIVSTTSGTRRVDYQLTDRLGSVDAIADANGTLIEARGYDAFGRPRTGTWGDAAKLASTTTTPHGFTGHEHLNQLELIHMNGRVYDYQLGRFMGVDPVIQFPLNSQSLNPYSYILNNPLRATDPTGYSTTNCSDVALGGAGSGTCTTTVDGKETTVDYSKKGSTLSVSVSGSGANAVLNAAAALSGAGKQSATSVNGRPDLASPASAKGNTANTAVSPGAPFPVTGSSVGDLDVSNASFPDIASATIDAAHEVATMYSYAGESLEHFTLWRHLLTQELTITYKFEFASALSFRPETPLGTEFRWAAAFSTSDSVVISAARSRIQDDGWVYMPGQDMHSHGVIRSGYRINKLDAAYANFATSSSKYSAGMKVNVPGQPSTNLPADLSHFSNADMKSIWPLWLSAPRELKRGYPGDWGE